MWSPRSLRRYGPDQVPRVSLNPRRPRELRAAGHDLRQLDFGGGLGIAYRDEAPPAILDYAAMVQEVTDGLDARLIFEPGRHMVGNAGILVTRVVYVKDGAQRRFLVLDSAMNDLIRPTLYELSLIHI